MTRNLDKRVELMFPIEDPQHKSKVMDVLRAMFRDTVKSRWLGADGLYRRSPLSSDERPYRVQDELQHEARRSSFAREGSGVSFLPEHREQPR